MSTSSEAVAGALPEQYHAFVDDAAAFPPRDLPQSEAVAAHHALLRSTYGPVVGTFLVSDVRLPELLATLDAHPPTGRAPAAGTEAAPLRVSLVVSGGAGALEPAVRWALRGVGLELRGVEIALRDEVDLAHNARRVATVVDQLRGSGDLDDEVPVYVEPPPFLGPDPGYLWSTALDEVAASGNRLKFRLSGPSGDGVPTSEELAACITAALDREVPFKCTAGLHSPLRERDSIAGRGRHGFVNVLLATRASLDGVDGAELAAVLDDTDPDRVRARLAEAGGPGLAAARRWFTSFGCCDVREALDGMVALGLLPGPSRSRP